MLRHIPGTYIFLCQNKVYLGLKIHVLSSNETLLSLFAEITQFIKHKNYLFFGNVKKVAYKWQRLGELFEESTPLTFAKFLLSPFLSRMIHFIMAFKCNSLEMYLVVLEGRGSGI